MDRPSTSMYSEYLKEEEEYSYDMDEDKPPNLAPGPLNIPARRPCYIPQKTVLLKQRPHSFAAPYSYSSVERYNEDVTMRFLFGNGKPLSTIDDPDFQTFLNTLNPSRMPPEARNMTTKAMTEKRPKLGYQKNIGPLNVTIEAIRKNDEVYLAISVHHYDSQGERHNTVHFEKIILADYEGKVVAERLRRVVDAEKAMSFGISNIMSPNLRLLKSVHESMPVGNFKNCFVCFFSYLTNIAREVIQLPEFLSSLKSLREYVEALRRHRVVYTKFKKMQMEANSIVDVPALDSDVDWLSTLQLLSACGILNETFTNLHENWCMPQYLDAIQENAMANLFDFLLVLCRITTQICTEDSCISQVLYSMSIVSNAVENCGIRTVREKMRTIFNKYCTAISKGKVGDFYALSAFLDPRYGYSTMIFSEEDWQDVEDKLVTEFGSTGRATEIIRSEIIRYHQLLTVRPEFDEVLTPSTWWFMQQDKLPLLYKQFLQYSGLPAVSIDGKRFFAKGGKFAHLFATLDEEMHLKAMLLAQSSQDFIGRGSSSHLIFSQIPDGVCTFRKLEDENYVKMEVTEQIVDVNSVEDVKQKIDELRDNESDSFEKIEQFIKEENQ